MRKRQILSEFDRVVHERTDAQKRAVRFEHLARELYEALKGMDRQVQEQMKETMEKVGMAAYVFDDETQAMWDAIARYEREVGE